MEFARLGMHSVRDTSTTGAMLTMTVGVLGKNMFAMVSSVNLVLMAILVMPLQIAQNALALTERADQIDTCRGTTTPLTIYTSSTLNRRSGRIQQIQPYLNWNLWVWCGAN